MEARKACRIYVGLLHLAAMHDDETALADYLAAVLNGGGTPDLEAARAVVAPAALAAIPALTAPDLAGYDALLRTSLVALRTVDIEFRDTTLDPLLAAGADRT